MEAVVVRPPLPSPNQPLGLARTMFHLRVLLAVCGVFTIAYGDSVVAEDSDTSPGDSRGRLIGNVLAVRSASLFSPLSSSPDPFGSTARR